MACRDLDFSWKEPFRDPSQFCYNQKNKSSPRSPDHRHKETRDHLWMDLPWIKEELRRNRVHDEFCVGKPSVHQKFQDRTALLNFIKACGQQKDLRNGSRIHDDILERGLLLKDMTLGNALLSMYTKCGALAKAQEIFDQLPARDVVTWNALIAGYAQHQLGDRALSCFERMRDDGLSPDPITFSCILKACGSIGAAEKGEAIHAEVRRQGLLENDIVLGTALVDMYARCGALAKAQTVFNELSARDVASWNALIAGYVQHGLGYEALSCFEHMHGEGLSPNAITYVCILKACGHIGAVEKGKEIHVKVTRQRLLERNAVIGNALVDMYAKCGALAEAHGVFDKLPARDVVAWNALIAGYAQHELGGEALSCFERMQKDGLYPDIVTFVCILMACGSIGAAEKGEEIHAEVGRQGLLEKDIVLGTALVDMYAKCGVLAKAQGVFDKLPARNAVSWNTLIAGYAQVGKVKTVFDLFFKMIEEGIKPDAVTFVVLLTACSHAGLVEEGQAYFDTMSTIHCIIPTLKHRTCIVDILSRAGHFDKAISVIQKMPPSECSVLWSVLIGACGKWVNVELGRWAFEHAVRLDEKFDAAYVCMSNLYAAAGMQEEADEVDPLMEDGIYQDVLGGLM